MQKLEEGVIVKFKEKVGKVPASNPCKRCKKPAEPKLVPIIGWKEQEYCKECLKTVLAEREKEAQRKLKEAGYTPEEIWEGLKRMKEDCWWKDKNPDYRNLTQNSLKFMPRRQKAGKYSHLAIKD